MGRRGGRTHRLHRVRERPRPGGARPDRAYLNVNTVPARRTTSSWCTTATSPGSRPPCRCRTARSRSRTSSSPTTRSQASRTTTRSSAGQSDFQAFILKGIPAGGLFTGAEVPKTPEQAAIWGGTAGRQYDPCYHLACDTFDNTSMHALDVNSDATAFAVLTYAYDEDGTAFRARRCPATSVSGRRRARRAPPGAAAEASTRSASGCSTIVGEGPAARGPSLPRRQRLAQTRAPRSDKVRA